MIFDCAPAPIFIWQPCGVFKQNGDVSGKIDPFCINTSDSAMLVFYNQVTDKFPGAKNPDKPRVFCADPSEDRLQGSCVFVLKLAKKELSSSNVATDTFYGLLAAPKEESGTPLVVSCAWGFALRVCGFVFGVRIVVLCFVSLGSVGLSR